MLFLTDVIEVCKKKIRSRCKEVRNIDKSYSQLMNYSLIIHALPILRTLFNQLFYYRGLTSTLDDRRRGKVSAVAIRRVILC